MDITLNENSIDGNIDLLESVLIEQGAPIDCPLKHTFVPGMYIREIFMPASELPLMTIVTSAVHNTEHPYFILKGKVAVFSENFGEQILEAGFHGITTPNTRRVLRIIEDTIWVTCHPTDIIPENNSEEAIEEAVKKILDNIIDKKINPIINGRYLNNVFIPDGNQIENEQKNLINNGN